MRKRARNSSKKDMRGNALQTNQIEVLNLFILEKEKKKKNTDQNINTCKVFWNPEHKYL